MTDQTALDLTPRARTGDPTTSHQAAERATRGAATLRDNIARLMAEHSPQWLTHDGIINVYQRATISHGYPLASESGIRTRVNELELRGIVERDEEPGGTNSNGARCHRFRFVSDPRRRDTLEHRARAAQVAKSGPRYVTPKQLEFLHHCPRGTVVLDPATIKVYQRGTGLGWDSPGSPGQFMVFDAPRRPDQTSIPAVLRVLYVPTEDASLTALRLFSALPTTPKGA